MTGTFIDTIVVCTITGLTIASSGVLGMVGADGKPLTGVALTMAAFSSNRRHRFLHRFHRYHPLCLLHHPRLGIQW